MSTASICYIHKFPVTYYINHTKIRMFPMHIKIFISFSCLFMVLYIFNSFFSPILSTAFFSEISSVLQSFLSL